MASNRATSQRPRGRTLKPRTKRRTRPLPEPAACALTEGFQSQSILIEEDPNNVIRAEFHHFGGQTKIFVATIFGDGAKIRTIRALSLSGPMYLRVGRSGDQWTVAYSTNGSSWTTATTFTQAMTVNAVGVFAGNGADTPHTAIVDYFFDTASPIGPYKTAACCEVVVTSASKQRIQEGRER